MLHCPLFIVERFSSSDAVDGWGDDCYDHDELIYTKYIFSLNVQYRGLILWDWNYEELLGFQIESSALWKLNII